MKAFSVELTLKCPVSSYSKAAIMSIDACQWFMSVRPVVGCLNPIRGIVAYTVLTAR